MRAAHPSTGLAPVLALALVGCHGASSTPPPTVTVADVERPATGAPPARSDPRPHACIEASPCIVVRLAPDGWVVNGTEVGEGELRDALNELATGPNEEPDAPFRGVVWVDLPSTTPFSKWMSAMSAVAHSRTIDAVVSEGPRVVPVVGLRYVSQPALMMMAERDAAYVMVAPDGTPPQKAAVETRTATPDDIAEVAKQLCDGPAPCWTLIALEADGMSFGELRVWLTSLQTLLFKRRAVRLTFDTEWGERLKRH